MDIHKPFDESKEYYFEEGCFIIEMLNDNIHPDLSIARARLEVGKTTRLHKLNNIVECYVIQSGVGKVSIGNKPPFTVSAGDVVVIPANAAQKIKNIGEQDLLFLALCTPRFVCEAYQDIDVDNEET